MDYEYLTMTIVADSSFSDRHETRITTDGILVAMILFGWSLVLLYAYGQLEPLMSPTHDVYVDYSRKFRNQHTLRDSDIGFRRKHDRSCDRRNAVVDTDGCTLLQKHRPDDKDYLGVLVDTLSVR